MHLNDLVSIIDTDGPFKWVSPNLVEGIDSVSLKAGNESKWFRKGTFVVDFEGEDEIITDYLCECLLERKTLISNGKNIPPELNINSIMIVNAGIYLISHFGSSYAGTHLSSWRELLTKHDASICLDALSHAYENLVFFEKDILRDFILEFFSYGPLWNPERGAFSKELSDEQNNFLRKVFEKGYSTIDNQDARLFSDGSKRI